LGTELPLAALQLQLSSSAAALTVLAIIFACFDALMKTAALVGIARRELSRAQGWRTAAGALVAKLLATVCLLFPINELLQPALASLTGSLAWLLRIGIVFGSALFFAIAIATMFFLVLLLLDRLANHAIVAVGERLSHIFGFWAVRPRREGKNGDSEPDFEITMASGEAVDDEDREYIENILEMGETTVREVMKPRPDVSALDVEWPSERILSEAADSRYSRFPVYEQTIDNIAGILHIRDVFAYLARMDGLDGFNLRELLKDAHFIPESKKVDDALREMQRGKWQMAVVLDEYGGTAGIVTVEDLLEEIVGEIQDEYDEEARQVHEREDGTFIVTANLALDDLNELFATEIESEDVDTLGGYIVNTLGRIPKPQDSVEDHGLRFTVLSVERKRIGRVRIERVAAEA
jgi:CBS domain containing-hemolysin-like protein